MVCNKPSGQSIFVRENITKESLHRQLYRPTLFGRMFGKDRGSDCLKSTRRTSSSATGVLSRLLLNESIYPPRFPVMCAFTEMKTGIQMKNGVFSKSYSFDLFCARL